jgi:hypothetical protein
MRLMWTLSAHRRGVRFAARLDAGPSPPTSSDGTPPGHGIDAVAGRWASYSITFDGGGTGLLSVRALMLEPGRRRAVAVFSTFAMRGHRQETGVHRL